MDKIRKYFYLITIVTIIEVVWILAFLKINIETSAIPTLVNGLTSSLSVIVGFMGAFIGIMYREVSKKDKKARTFYFGAMFLMIAPLTLLWTTYSFLTMGWLETAVRYGLFSLIITLYMFFAVILNTVKILNIEMDKM